MARKKAKKKATKKVVKSGRTKPLSVYIGQRVRKERLRQKISTTGLAEKMKVSQAQVSRLELGRQGWRTVQIENVASILGIPVAGLTAPKTAVEVAVRYANGTTKSWAV